MSRGVSGVGSVPALEGHRELVARGCSSAEQNGGRVAVAELRALVTFAL